MAKNKNFRDDPVMKFISLPQQKASDNRSASAMEPLTEIVLTESRPAAATESKSIDFQQNKKAACPFPSPAIKNNPKSRRVQLLFRDSLYSDVKNAADTANLSVNEWIHRTLEAALNKH